jgi:phosphohistidine phosphatase
LHPATKVHGIMTTLESLSGSQRELLVLRHAKSDQGLGLVDFDRPLNRRGQKAARRMGQWLGQSLKGTLDRVICSPAMRTRETAQLLLEAMGHDGLEIQWQQAIYEASRQQLLALLATLPADARRVLLIGHNPGLEELLLWLVGGRLVVPEGAKLLPTAALAWLELPQDWRLLKPGCARLRLLMRPETLISIQGS